MEDLFLADDGIGDSTCPVFSSDMSISGFVQQE
jgi:hypothetical protein